MNWEKVLSARVLYYFHSYYSHSWYGNIVWLLGKQKKRGFLRGFYKFVVQIHPVQTLNFSIKTMLTNLPSITVSIKHTKKLKDIFSCILNLSNKQKLLKQYQNLVEPEIIV